MSKYKLYNCKLCISWCMQPFWKCKPTGKSCGSAGEVVGVVLLIQALVEVGSLGLLAFLVIMIGLVHCRTGGHKELDEEELEETERRMQHIEEDRSFLMMVNCMMNLET
ncbi:hypothetical protein Hanom_Chr01g00010821 [Helianthus anomalus]